MAADFDKPTSTSDYLLFAGEVRDNMDAVAKMDFAGASNIPTDAIRINATFTGLEKWNGASWGPIDVQRGIDDTPVDGETGEGITSNWAFDHAAATVAHGVSGAVVGTTNSQVLTNKTLTSPVLNTGVSGTAFLDEDDMNSDSATKLASQQSIKAFVTSGTVAMSNKTLTSPVLNTGVSGTAFLDEDDMNSDSATKLASQQSIKAYVLSQVHAESHTAASHSDISATGAEINAACDGSTAKNSHVHKKSYCINLCDADTALVTGNGIIPFVVPLEMDGMDLTNAIVACGTLGSAGTTTVQIRRRRGGANADMLTTPLTMAYTEYYVSDESVNTSNDDVNDGDQIYIDIDGVATGVKGVSVTLTFT